jgi:hypothetical protein
MQHHVENNQVAANLDFSGHGRIAKNKFYAATATVSDCGTGFI